MPFWRACFAFIYCYPLLKRIKNTSTLQGIASEFSPYWNSWIWILMFNLSSFSNEPLVIAVSYLSVISLLPIQVAVNQLNQKIVPGHNPNSSFSKLNIVLIVLWSGLTICGFIVPK